MAIMEPRGPRRSRETTRWSLPRILEVAFRPVKHEVPRIYYVGRERRQTSETVEIMVRTAAPLPIRALSPVIYVGDVPVEDYEVAGRNLYKYLAFNPSALLPGAPVSLGWPGQPVESRIAAAARYGPAVS
jgi:hypothetical protein